MSYIDDEELKIGDTDEEEEVEGEGEIDSEENFNDLLDDDIEELGEGDELFSEEVKILEETDI
jgi:hypothetical protein